LYFYVRSTAGIHNKSNIFGFFTKSEKFRFFLNLGGFCADVNSSTGKITCKTKIIEAVTVQTLNPNWIRRKLEFLPLQRNFICRGDLILESPRGAIQVIESRRVVISESLP